VREREVAPETDGDRLSGFGSSKDNERHVQLEQVLNERNDASLNCVYPWVRSPATSHRCVGASMVGMVQKRLHA